MNVQIFFVNSPTVNVQGISNVQEEGSFTNFYIDNTLPFVSVRTAEILYWQRVS